MRTAKNEGYLAGNRDFCRQQAAEIHPLECVSKCQEMQFRADLTAFQGDFPQACRVRAPGKLSSGEFSVVRAPGKLSSGEFSVRTGRSLLSNGAEPPVERGGRPLVASQGKSTQKCSQRRRNCASGILETHSNGLRALCGISLAPAVWRRLIICPSLRTYFFWSIISRSWDSIDSYSSFVCVRAYLQYTPMSATVLL